MTSLKIHLSWGKLALKEMNSEHRIWETEMQGAKQIHKSITLLISSVFYDDINLRPLSCWPSVFAVSI